MTPPTPAQPPLPDLDELARGVLDESDAQVLDELAGLYERLDPVPPGLIDRIQFGITLDALEAEIAELQRTSDLAGARSEGATAAQSVTFTSATFTTMVTITPTSSERVRVDGWVAPGAGVRVELRVVDGTLATTADEDGRFVLVDVPRGLAQFVLRPAGTAPQPPVITPSIEL